MDGNATGAAIVGRTTTHFAISLLLALSNTAYAQHVPDLRTAPNALLTIDQNRGSVVDKIVAQWGDQLAQSDAAMSSEQLRTMLDGMRADYLFAASLVGNIDGLRNVIASALHGSEPSSAKRVAAKVLGDASDDLVYTPVVPCRLADTRLAGGPIAGGGSRDFKVWVSSGGFTAQGGDAGNCNIPANPAAVALNLAVVNVQGSGNLTVYPTGGAVPNTSALNYFSGVFAISNGAIAPACIPNCANQITIKANPAGTDVVVDIVGYFKAPGTGSPQALDCIRNRPSSTFLVLNNTTGAGSSALCAAGYSLTGGGCWSPSSIDVLITSTIGYGSLDNRWVCNAKNSTGQTVQINIDTICCRVPGLP